jgi:hypothetical protein
MATIKQVVEAFREAGKEEEKATDMLRALMAGLPPAKREERIKAVYKECRTIDGREVKARDLLPADKRTYGKIREAYSSLYSSKKRGSKKRSSKATVTKVQGVAKGQIKVIATKPKKLSDTLRVILATIQATEKPTFKDVPKLVAALQACIDLAV